MPTSAEINDITNAVFDGCDAIMLTGITAMGNYPRKSVRICSKVILEAEARIRLDSSLDRRLDLKPNPDNLAVIS